MEREQVPMNIEQAVIKVSLIMQECYTEGANDHEIPELKHIIEKLQAEELSIAKALKKAHDIQNRKALDH